MRREYGVGVCGPSRDGPSKEASDEREVRTSEGPGGETGAFFQLLRLLF